MSTLQKFASALLCCTIATLLVAAANFAGARDAGRESALPTIATINYSALPAEAQSTLQLIKNGGPFPYRKDDSIFGNRERVLPRQARGYYKEYTVKTPGAGNRGARRIIAGQPGEFYYTGDHYVTFQRIVE